MIVGAQRFVRHEFVGRLPGHAGLVGEAGWVKQQQPGGVAQQHVRTEDGQRMQGHAAKLSLPVQLSRHGIDRGAQPTRSALGERRQQ